MPSYATLDHVNLSGKRVLLRVDINAPLHEGQVTDDTRLRAIAPTVWDIMRKGGKPILLAHLGRPNGKHNTSLSLRVLRQPLSAALGVPVKFSESRDFCISEAWFQSLGDREIALLENVRFDPREMKNDPDFSKTLADLADVYVNDAFSVSHRAHASVVGVSKLLPSAAGRLMETELSALENALSTPQRPVIAVVGGAKVSTKLDLLANLIDKVDQIIIGGGMANTFLASEGKPVGTSLCEHDLLETARSIMTKAAGSNCEIVLPSDIVVARKFEKHAPSNIVANDACPEDSMILDAGPKSVEDFARRFSGAKTIIWNGPLGAFELPPFNAATDAAAQAAAALASTGVVQVIAGGGDTVAALNGCGAAGQFSYVSTAGGAFLEWLEGKTLPGIAALQNTQEETA